MATSRRESLPNGRTNRTIRNTSPVPKPGGSDQGLLRRARSVPSSPDRRPSASTDASSSANAGRPSSSFSPRSPASSRSSASGSASSSSPAHGKALLHSVSAMVGAKQAAGVLRRRADKSGAGAASSVWPHALTTPTKDPASRAAKSPSPNAQRSKLPARTGAERTLAAFSPKPRTTQKATTGAAGKPQANSSSSSRHLGALAKRRAGLETSALSIQRTTSVPVPVAAAAAAAALKAEEQDVQLMMEGFDEMDCIGTPSIEEHLQERLPDPVDVTTYDNGEQHKNDQEVIAGQSHSPEKTEDLDGGGDADVGLDAGAIVVEEAANEAEMEEPVAEAESKEPVGETELNETVGEIQVKGAADETKLLNEGDSETEQKDPEQLAVKEEAEADEERIVLPATKTPEAVQGWRKDDGRSNEVTERGRSKTTMQERRNKVMALVGRFETAMSGRE